MTAYCNHIIYPLLLFFIHFIILHLFIFLINIIAQKFKLTFFFSKSEMFLTNNVPLERRCFIECNIEKLLILQWSVIFNVFILRKNKPYRVVRLIKNKIINTLNGCSNYLARFKNKILFATIDRLQIEKNTVHRKATWPSLCQTTIIV